MGLGRGRKKGKKRERESSQDEPVCVVCECVCVCVCVCVSNKLWSTLNKVEEEQCIKRKNGEIATEGDDNEGETTQEGHIYTSNYRRQNKIDST